MLEALYVSGYLKLVLLFVESPDRGICRFCIYLLGKNVANCFPFGTLRELHAPVVGEARSLASDYALLDCRLLRTCIQNTTVKSQNAGSTALSKYLFSMHKIANPLQQRQRERIAFESYPSHPTAAMHHPTASHPSYPSTP
jgi:hypothetical protein